MTSRPKRTSFSGSRAEAYRGGSGSPLALLHGFTNSWTAWKPVLAELEQRHRVFAPALPGHYGGPPFDAESVSIETMADLFERQLSDEGIDRAHFAGNSMGGLLSLEMAMRGRALSVVAVCPAGGWERGSSEERAVARVFQRNKAALRFVGPWIETIARNRRLRAIAFREMAAFPERLDALQAKDGLHAAAGCTIVDKTLLRLKAGQLFGDLRPVECPVRIAYSTRDRVLRHPGYYARFRRTLPDIEWVPLEGLGHIPMSDDPEQVARVILEVTSADEDSHRVAPERVRTATESSN
jgi:pimeloyl-ACP methyl ester carboxylesterase